MPVFPSGDWMTAFCDALRAHPEAIDVATALDGVYRFVVEPWGPLQERHAYDVEIRADGGSPHVAWAPAAGDDSPNLTLTASYQRWRQMIEGELDIGLAVMLRRVQVSGDLPRLLSQLSKTEPLREALVAVDTQWLGA